MSEEQRLRDWCEEPQDVSHGELAEYSHKAADEIAQLRADKAELVASVKSLTRTFYHDEKSFHRAMREANDILKRMKEKDQ